MGVNTAYLGGIITWSCSRSDLYLALFKHLAYYCKSYGCSIFGGIELMVGVRHQNPHRPAGHIPLSASPESATAPFLCYHWVPHIEAEFTYGRFAAGFTQVISTMDYSMRQVNEISHLIHMQWTFHKEK